jgi:CTP:molybdopterin cytidylyltransferase MocA
MSPRIGAAVLAAGSSRRLGRPKQLVVWHGVPLVRRAVEALRRPWCEAVAVVVGEHAGEIAEAVDGFSAEVLQNASWSEGVSASVRAATRWARARAFDALLLAVCDQPGLSGEHVDALRDAFYHRMTIVASVYATVRGVPAVFPSSSFADLAMLRGDRGAGALLRDAPEVAEVPWEAGAFDIDTPDDLRVAADATFTCHHRPSRV